MKEVVGHVFFRQDIQFQCESLWVKLDILARDAAGGVEVTAFHRSDKLLGVR